MDKEELKNILTKAVDLEKGKNIAFAKEFLNIEKGITDLKDSLDNVTTKIDEEIIVELEIV